MEGREKSQFEREWVNYKRVCSSNINNKWVKNSPENGGIFFAVAGAKLSEGIDFTDGMARLVVVVGVPFKNSKSSKIEQKKKYLDAIIRHYEAQKNPLYQSGSTWYQYEMARTVNQAMGRVIRHKYDFGSVILLDSRYNWGVNRENLSGWIKPHIKSVEFEENCAENLKDFFAQAQTYVNQQK